MTALPKHAMTVDEFLAWAETVPGRHELVEGQVFAMSPERVRHAQAKFAVQKALEQGIQQCGAPCHMLPDGMTVRVHERTAYEPDALVYCGEPLDGNAVEVPNPIIVVEVLSPGTGAHDAGSKLAGYFRVASVQHYLIVDPLQKVVVHHQRGAKHIETRIAGNGTIALQPPGLQLSIDDIFPEPRP